MLDVLEVHEFPSGELMMVPFFPTATKIVGIDFLTLPASVTSGVEIASLDVKRRVMFSPDLANEFERVLSEKRRY